MRIERQAHELAKRAEAIKIIEEFYGQPVDCPAGKSSIQLCGIVLEWPEALDLAAFITETEKASKKKGGGK